jgi:subtilase family serine protease
MKVQRRKSARIAGAVIAALALATVVTTGAALPSRTVAAGGHMHPAYVSNAQFDGHYGLDNNGHYGGHYGVVMDGEHSFNCQKPSAPYNCYGPDEMQAAYGFTPLLNDGKDGSGQTIVIVDAFQNPTMAKDLKKFDKAFGLPDPEFKTFAPDGITPFDPTDPNQVGWAGEIALDVEWAHAMAPGAKIDLVLAASDADPDLVSAETYAVNHRLGNVMSMSFSEAENCMDPALQAQQHKLFNKANAQGMSLFAAAGDYGAAQPTCDFSSVEKSAGIPASDPDVTGVGGTDLVADLKTGAYQSESVWNEPTYPSAGGGGFSTLYSRPGFQNGAVHNSMRGVPDVTYSASNQHGAIVAWGSSGSQGEFWIFAGTSVGTPQWAALAAIADQVNGHALGNLNPALYDMSNHNGTFNDVTVGNNNFDPVTGYAAAPGWDAASGLGSPEANHIVARLASSDD